MALIPTPKTHERDFVVEDFLLLQECHKVGEKKHSDVYSIGDHMKVRLMLFPKGTEAKQHSLSVFIEVLPPSIPNEDKIITWRYPDVSYYIACVDWKDPHKSKFNQDTFTFSENDTDRGWHNFVQLDKIQHYLGPGNRMLLRFGVIPHGLQYTTADTNYRGLKNHGTTCYLNSLLQCLFHVGSFCSSIYAMTAEEDRLLLKEKRHLREEQATTRELKKRRAEQDDDPCKQNINEADSLHDLISDDDDEDALESRSWTDEEVAMALEDTSTSLVVGNVSVDLSESSIARALQRVFYNLSQDDIGEAVQCRELIRSFGWNTADQFTQHDAQELNRLLCDRLEDRMKNTPADGTIKRLFGGDSEVYIECTQVDYKSKRSEVFYDLQLDVKDLPSLEASLDEYVKEELLDGDNKYNAEGFGAQPAVKGIRFLKLPPVLQFHLKRFQFDIQSYDMVKVNDEFRFPETICFDKWCPDSGVYRLFAVNVHNGDVHEGHYYAFVRVPRRTLEREDVFEQCDWVKFDDEYVWRCTADQAIAENFGGDRTDTSNPFIDTSGPRAKRNFSAYILFYIKEGMARELLQPPIPKLINPGMVLRIILQEKFLRKHNRIRRDIESFIKIYLFSESDLYSAPSGVWRLPLEAQIRKTLKCQRDTPAFTLWQQIYKAILQGELGEDLQSIYANDKSLVPGLFYFDYFEPQNPTKRYPPPTVQSLAAASGWNEATCPADELGYGVRLWNLVFEEPSRTYHPSSLDVQQVTLQVNATYLNAEATQGKRPSLSIIIHPLKSPPQMSHSSTNIQNLHESRQLISLKVFDSFTASAIDQNTYFVGLLDIALDRGPINFIDLVVAKIVETWTSQAAHSQILKALPYNSALANHLDALVKSWQPDTCTEDQKDLALYYEHRGFYEHVSNLQSFRASHNFRIVCVCFPGASEDDLNSWRDKTRSQFEAIETTLQNVKLPDSQSIDEISYFFGRPSPIPSASVNLVPPLPTQPPAPTPTQWLQTLRSMRRVRVQVCDVGQYYGRFETLDAKPRADEGAVKRTDTAASIDKSECDATITPKYLESQKSTSDGGSIPVHEETDLDSLPVMMAVDAEIDLQCQASLILKWICLVLLKIDPNYLRLFPHQPRHVLCAQERTFLCPDSLAREEPVDLMSVLRKRGSMADRFVSLVQSQGKYGLVTKLLKQCAHVRGREPPTIWLCLSPRKSSITSLFVRLFDPQAGTLGAVCVDRPVEDVGGLVSLVKQSVVINHLQSRTSLNVADWLEQDFDLVQHSSISLQRSSNEIPISSLSDLSHILSEIPVRVEPKPKWFGGVPPPGVLGAVTMILGDEPVGYPFTFMILLGELYQSMKLRLASMLTHSLPQIATAKVFKCLCENRMLLKDNDVVVDEKEVIFSTPQTISRPYFLIQLCADPARRAVTQPRFNASLHIRA